MRHPVIGAELAREGVDWTKATAIKEGEAGKQPKEKRGPSLAQFESGVDMTWKQDMYSQCQRGLDRKERAKEAEIGIFGFGTDWEKVKQLENQVVESCEELRRRGIIR